MQKNYIGNNYLRCRAQGRTKQLEKMFIYEFQAKIYSAFGDMEYYFSTSLFSISHFRGERKVDVDTDGQ